MTVLQSQANESLAMSVRKGLWDARQTMNPDPPRVPSFSGQNENIYKSRNNSRLRVGSKSLVSHTLLQGNTVDEESWL